MVCQSFTTILILVTAIYLLQAQCSPVVLQKRGICATEDPDTSFLDAIQRVTSEEDSPQLPSSEARQGPIEIDTWFHVVASKSEASQVSDDMINSQVSSKCVGFQNLC